MLHKHLFVRAALIGAAPLIVACSEDAVSPGFTAPAGSMLSGNGAPAGQHYSLNIIGVPKNKTADMTGNSGHRIFVPLEGNTKIWLCESGEDLDCGDVAAGDFQVIDANGTDGSATFALPAADTDPDNCTVVGTNPDGSDIIRCGTGVTIYSVFVRALGRKGGSATLTTCGTVDGDIVCTDPSSALELDSDSRPSKFQNASAELLYLYNVDIDGDGDVDYRRIPLFSSVLEGYFWDVDNNGLRIAQLRFYPCSSTVGNESAEVVSSACQLTGNGS